MSKVIALGYALERSAFSDFWALAGGCKELLASGTLAAIRPEDRAHGPLGHYSLLVGSMLTLMRAHASPPCALLLVWHMNAWWGDRDASSFHACHTCSTWLPRRGPGQHHHAARDLFPADPQVGAGQLPGAAAGGARQTGGWTDELEGGEGRGGDGREQN